MARTKEEFGAFRALLPATEHCAYLNTAGSGPMALPVHDAIEGFYDRLTFLGQINTDVYDESNRHMERARKTIAGFIGAEPGEVFYTRCIAEGINTLLYMINWRPGDEVIITEKENPASILPFINSKERFGLKIKKIKIGKTQEEILEELSSKITGKTRLLMLSHVTHTDGTLLPAKQICEIARKKGILSAFDGAQACGALPVNVKEIGCDFYFYSCHKWLLGPEGAAAAYVKGDLIEKMPPPFAGVGTQSSFDIVNDTISYAAGAKRYEFGGRHRALYFGFESAVKLSEEIGVNNAYERSMELFRYLCSRLEAVPGIEILSPADERLRSAILSFRIPGLDHRAMVKEAWKRERIIIQWRVLNLATKEEGIRVSLAWFVTENELDKLAEFFSSYLQEMQI